MNDAERIETILREEMARLGIETALLHSGAIAVLREDDRYYVAIADIGHEVPWKRFRIRAVDSDEELRAVIQHALGPDDLDQLRALRRSERDHLGGPPGEC